MNTAGRPTRHKDGSAFITSLSESREGKRVNSLLIDFFNRKLNDYIAPEKKGTPRGTPVGFSKVKYIASLMTLTNWKQKDIAANLNISHGLLRKWQTEEEFKQLASRHRLQFAAEIWDHIFTKIFNWLITNQAFLVRFDKFQEIIRSKAEQHPTWPEFNDICLYSDRLINVLSALLPTLNRRANTALNLVLDQGTNKRVSKIRKKHITMCSNFAKMETERIIRDNIVLGKSSNDKTADKVFMANAEQHFLNDPIQAANDYFDEAIALLREGPITKSDTMRIIRILEYLKQEHGIALLAERRPSND